MATLPELSEKLLKRFKDVPNVTKEDTDMWIERSFMEHGYRTDQEVPLQDEILVLLYAEWDGTLQIALRASHYFEYKDSDESVDKRNVSEQYRHIATELRREYDRVRSRHASATSRFSIATRADR